MPGTTAQFDGGQQLTALLKGSADQPSRGFLGVQWPANLGSLSWRWLWRLKAASGEIPGIFASAFQRVAMGQKLPFADLAVLPAGVRRRGWMGVTAISLPAYARSLAFWVRYRR